MRFTIQRNCLFLALLLTAVGCDDETQVPEPKVEVVVCDNTVPLEKRIRESWTRWANGRRITPCDEITLSEALVGARNQARLPPPSPRKKKK